MGKERAERGRESEEEGAVPWTLVASNILADDFGRRVTRPELVRVELFGSSIR